MSFLDDAALDGLRSLASGLGPGDVIAERFEIREPIGEGAMGQVFAAWDRERETEVALKVLREARDSERFAREALILAGLGHPGLVRYVAHGNDDATYVAMERLTGCTLAERLRQAPLSARDTSRVATQIADALAAVHAAGVLHRDVKPSNIFLVDAAIDDVRLIDFGLARADTPDELTATGALVGTPGYMAPEQVRGESDLDGRADVFALGCVVYECLAGRPAFVADSAEQLFAKILLETPSSLDTSALSSLVAAMLDKDAARRPTAAEIVTRLAAIDVTRGSAPRSPARVAPGDVIAEKYVVSAEIGRGGMGLVVSAKHRELGTEVALKILQRTDGRDADEARFLREAQAAARMESDHAVRVTDVGRLADGSPFIVMERLRGRDLAAELRETGPFPVERAAGIVLEACEALAEAHALGIVHRDLKPSNLFATERRDGTPLIKVLDFGISKITRPLDDVSLAALSITSPSAVMGSAPYMSPEQLRASKAVDARTDIWSLGVVLHELIAGRPPFYSDSPAAIGALIATEPPAELDAPLALRAVVRRCLEKRASDRYQDVGELATALAPFGPQTSEARVSRIHRVLASGPEHPPHPSTPAPDAHATAQTWDASRDPASTRSTWKWALALVVAISGVGLGLTASDPPRPAAMQHTTRLPAVDNAPAAPPTAPQPVEPPPVEPPAVQPPPVEPPPDQPLPVQPQAVEPQPISAPPKPLPTPRPPPPPKPPTEVDLLDPALEQR